MLTLTQTSPAEVASFQPTSTSSTSTAIIKDAVKVIAVSRTAPCSFGAPSENRQSKTSGRDGEWRRRVGDRNEEVAVVLLESPPTPSVIASPTTETAPADHSTITITAIYNNYSNKNDSVTAAAS
ncbi:hypothetical protein PoB_005082700 [Plakobranchus ocellatus]|uniref:Uncharacterized protein n=1 Tax=Plakobranchus ocellatus TaxID=259542 RepID=A0AAV4BYV0_9GAST|nr:hypothetical protein PoB_005082700 [Plakobranchus ocellatus]